MHAPGAGCLGCRRRLLARPPACLPSTSPQHSSSPCSAAMHRPAPTLDQQVAVCRALERALPASLPPQAASQLTTLASGWLVPAASSSDGAAAVQLQAEAAHLHTALLGTARVKLSPAAARQLLQQVCRLCQRPPRPASVAAAELDCGCADLLALLPQWYPQAPKPELAAAVTAAAAALERHAGGGGGAGPPLETAATTRLLCKLLRALQVLLTEVSAGAGRVRAVGPSKAPTPTACFAATIPPGMHHLLPMLNCRPRRSTAQMPPAWPLPCNASSRTAGSRAAAAAAAARRGGAPAAAAAQHLRRQRQ